MTNICDRVDALRAEVQDEIKALCARRLVLAGLSKFVGEVQVIGSSVVGMATYGSDEIVLTINLGGLRPPQRAGVATAPTSVVPAPVPAPPPPPALAERPVDHGKVPDPVTGPSPADIEAVMAKLTAGDSADIEDAPRPPAPVLAEDDTTPGLTPAADPYSAEEEDRIRALHAEGADNAEIARALGRRAQGFHHAVTRIVAARRATPAVTTCPNGVDAGIWDHLTTVGNSKIWTPALDLELGNLMLGGAKMAHAAAQLGVGREDVEARWTQLVPNRNLIDCVRKTVAALEARASAK